MEDANADLEREIGDRIVEASKEYAEEAGIPELQRSGVGVLVGNNMVLVKFAASRYWRRTELYTCVARVTRDMGIDIWHVL